MTSGSKYQVLSDAEGAFAFITSFYSLYRAENQKGIILKKGDETIAAVLFVEYNGSNLFMHVAGKPGSRWLTRDFLHWAFRYPFVDLECTRVTAWVEATNFQSRRFVEHMGWKPEAILEKAGQDGVDVILYRMFKGDCRYV